MSPPAADGGVLLRLEVAGQPVVAVGAGRVAARKLRALLDAGAQVTIVAPDAVGELAEAAAAGALSWRRRTWEPADLAGAMLVVAATASSAVNAAVAAEAAARRIWCVRVDAGGTAAFVATVRRGPVSVGVTTTGRAPALARHLRDEIGEQVTPEHGRLATLLGELREDPQVQAALAGLPSAARAARWRSVLATDILALLRSGQIDLAREVARSCLCSSSD